VSHLPEEVIREIESILFGTERPVQERFFKGRGVDFRNRDIELWPRRTSSAGATACPGWWSTGRRRPPFRTVRRRGRGLRFQGASDRSLCFRGDRRRAGGRLPGLPAAPRIDREQIGAVQKKIERRGEGKKNGVDVQDLEFKVRRLINDYVVSPKNAYKLGRWMEWAERFEREIEEEVSVANGHELSKVLEVEHIIQCATFSARAALERKESRWGNAHQRTDFPQRDDPNWLCHVDVRRGKDGEMEVGTRPSSAPLLRRCQMRSDVNIFIHRDKCYVCGICVERCILDNLRMYLAPCRTACPIHMNCQGYVRLISREKKRRRPKRRARTLPLPESSAGVHPSL